MQYIFTLLALLTLPFLTQAQSVSTLDTAYIELQGQGSGGTIRMGETSEVGRFRLSNRSGKAIVLNRISFRNYGTADLDESFENFMIQNNGVTLTDTALVTRNTVSFTFRDILIDRGDSLVLSVAGRLIYAQSGETIELGIRRQEDVDTSMLGLDYFSLECRDCEGIRGKEKTLRAGGIYIRSTSPFQSARNFRSSRRTTASFFNRSYQRPSLRSTSLTSRYYYRPAGNQSYSPGSRDIRFFSTFINSKIDAQVEGLFLSLANGSEASDKNNNGVSNELDDFSDSFSDFNLFVNNQRVDSTNDFMTENGKAGLLFNSTFDIPANAQILLTGRISSQAVTGDRVKFSLDKNGLRDPVYLYNQRSVNTSNINGGSSSNFSSTGNQPLSITR
jgi:hypothetical protein